MPTNPLTTLNILPAYPDRATYDSVLGTQAPIFDPAIGAVKQWQDPAAVGLPATALMTYTRLDPAGTPNLTTFTLPAGVAARVNLTGKPVYAKYFITPTDATGVETFGAFVQTVAVQPNTLSLLSQAQALQALVPSTILDEAALTSFVKTTYPADEPRRQWLLQFADGQQSYVGDLVNAMNSGGVGAPGHWDTTGGHLAWVIDPIPDGSDKVYPVMDVPKRALLPGETLVTQTVGGLGFTEVVVQSGPAPVAGGVDPVAFAKLVSQVQFMYTEMGGK